MSDKPHAPHGDGAHGDGGHADHGHGHGSRFIQHHYDDAQHQFESGKFGIWLFLAQEVLFFSALFVAYILYRYHHPEIYSYAHKYLDVKYGAINTAVLIFSSLTAAWAVRAAQLNQRKLLIGCIALTIGCALAFLGVKYIEYNHKVHEQILFGRYFDPCVSSGGTPLLTKSNACSGHKSSALWKDGVPAGGCFADIDQEPLKPEVQADCKVVETTVEIYKAPKLAPGATHDCKTVPVAFIQGDNGTYTFTGLCDEIMVVGNKNTLRIDQAKKVAVKGESNTIEGNGLDSFVSLANNALRVAKGVSGPVPSLGAVADSDVDPEKEYTKVAKQTPIVNRCPEQLFSHDAVQPPKSYPCWRVGYQPAVCTKESAPKGKDKVGVIVEYGDHAHRGPRIRIDAECKPTPKPPAGDPLADKVVPLEVGKKSMAPYQRPTTHEAHEREAAGPPPENTGMFFTIYFAMTGLHGIHVLFGVFVFTWLLIRAIKGHFTPDYFGPIDFAALYWHIVDLIWIFLFPLLYLIH